MKKRLNITNASDFDFRHHLYDTIILLGGKKEIADLLIASQDLMVTRGDVDQLRNYNAALVDRVKARLANIKKTKIQAQLER
ncbi:MAG TPA: hypothetical protein VN784_09925 [Candidatus Limnocylindrales bacterium]|nr:hypothetical protein [Candidatus Limnocylindrales bacterium]